MAISELAAAPAPTRRPLRVGSSGEALVHIGVAFLLLGLTVASFVVSTTFGVAVCFALTLGLAIMMPNAMPVIIICSFLFQNMVIASFTPLLSGAEAFDTLRGVNFVILMATYGAFLIATFQQRLRHVTQLRPWLLISLVLVALIGFYFGLGALRGNPRDALVYFRNTVTPLACFHIAFVAASLYRIELEKSLLWLGIAAVAYGYCELFFTFDFLSLFHGDDYVKRQMAQQIENGTWEKILQETGFVLRNLQDTMTTEFFNTQFFGDLFPRVFRIGGPNFHPIAFAYALTILSIWLLVSGRRLLPLVALPLLVVIGSKGAMAMLLFALLTSLAARFVRPAAATALFVMLTIAWIGAALVVGTAGGDFHVLGFYAGMREFLADPLGQGLGIGGNLSSATSVQLDWSLSQASGVANIPVESAVGVMLYQMGVGGFLFFGFLLALAVTSRRLFLRTGDRRFLFAFVTVTSISANAVLQEEAFYSPLALGLCLLLVGLVLGSYWRDQNGRRPNAAMV